jgi:hypothetical protein
MADDKKTVVEHKALKCPCLIERKFTVDSATGDAFKYIQLSVLVGGEVFRVKCENDKRFLESLLVREGVVVTDSNDDIVSAEDLAKVKDYAATSKAKFGV